MLRSHTTVARWLVQDSNKVLFDHYVNESLEFEKGRKGHNKKYIASSNHLDIAM